jgi:acetyl-CoA carboxylase/biotin carboxylase 1
MAVVFCLQGSEHFEIENTPQRLPQKHVVAVRITSENASDGFKPTAGRVDEVSVASIQSS